MTKRVSLFEEVKFAWRYGLVAYRQVSRIEEEYINDQSYILYLLAHSQVHIEESDHGCKA
jgi:hypothetical protein